MSSAESKTVTVSQPATKSGRGGYRPGSGRPKGGSRTSKTPQVARSVRLIAQKREKELWKLALEVAEQTRNADQLIRALVHVNEIQRGRPYVATNPNAAPAPPQGDSRLLMAIQNLQIVSQSPSQIHQSQAIDSKAICELPSKCQSLSSESDIEAEQTDGKSSADR